jgi:DNA polymerase-4
MKVILPEDAPAFLEAMKIEKFHGIGKATAAKMHKLGIYTGSDLKKISEHNLHQRFGDLPPFGSPIPKLDFDSMSRPAVAAGA